MSHIDDLIRDLHPNGVERIPLHKIVTFNKGSNLKELQRIPGPFPVVTASRRETSTHHEFNFEGESITISTHGAHAGFVNYWNQPTYLSNNVFLIKPQSSQLSPRYLYHHLKLIQPNIQSMRKQGGIPYINTRDLASISIPKPSPEIQVKTVDILDQFTELETELEAELEARKLQFTYYRNTLILQNATHYTPAKLKDIGRIITGKTPPATAEDSWGEHTNFATPSDIRTDTTRLSTTRRQLSAAGAKRLRNSLVPSGSILVTCIGADMGKAVENIGDCIPNQQINAIINDGSFSSRYLVHVLSNMRTTLQRKASQGGGTMPLINKSDFSLIELSLPPLKEQYRIADILDDFDTLVNDLSSGLPAEIEARRKQYEYYRDRLLTFPEKK